MLIASIRYCGRYEDAGRYFEKLRQRVQEHIAGPPFCLFTERCVAGRVDIECCYPVDQAVETDGIKCRVLRGGEMLAMTHYGPCRTLGESWEALFDYIEGANIRVKGPRREIYLDTEELASEEHVTEIQVPLAGEC